MTDRIIAIILMVVGIALGMAFPDYWYLLLPAIWLMALLLVKIVPDQGA